MQFKLFFFAFLFYAKHNNIQAQSKYDCDLIKVILLNLEVKKNFYFDYDKELEIVFVDNKRFFQNCIFDKIYNKEVRIISDSSVMESRFYNGVLISNIVQEKGLIIVYLYQKSTGAAGNVKVKIRRRKYSVVDVRIGNY